MAELSATGIGSYSLQVDAHFDKGWLTEAHEIFNVDPVDVKMVLDAIVICTGSDRPTEPPDDTTSRPFALKVLNPGDQDLGATFEVRAEVTPNIGPGGTDESPRAVTMGAFTADGPNSPR